VIDAHNLTKRYGDKTAVDDLTFTVNPGIVTGFLGPNGSGKSTTMRLILALDARSQGMVTVDGKRYRDYPAPLHEVGVLLEARSVHTELRGQASTKTRLGTFEDRLAISGKRDDAAGRRDANARDRDRAASGRDLAAEARDLA
jgi:ABC-type multidrug transport system ATPase subunit